MGIPIVGLKIHVDVDVDLKISFSLATGFPIRLRVVPHSLRPSRVTRKNTASTISHGHFFLAVSFCITHERGKERGTTHSQI